MRPFIAFLLVLFNLPQAEAQLNLVANPSFEDTLNCNNFPFYQAGFPWFTPTNCTPDYYYGLIPTCGYSALQNQNGHQIPYDGNAYVGIFLADPLGTGINAREYITVGLLDTLLPNEEYFIEFFISRANLYYLATDDIGAYVSSQLPLNTGCSYLSYQPQVENPQGNIVTDSLNWTQISGIFTAQGGEMFLTIGNFKDSINTTVVDADNGNGEYNNAYYYIDKISLIPLDSLQNLNENTEKYNLIKVFPTLLQQGKLITVISKLVNISSYELFNVDGKIIKKGGIYPGSNQIEFNKCVPGLYLLNVLSENGRIVEKIVLY